MNCSLCDHPNAASRNYCGACGGSLARYCCVCGFRNEIPDRFCGGCGSALGETAVRATPAATTPAPRASRPLAPEPAPLAPPSPPSALDELLEAARDGAQPEPDDAEIRVSQGDIDSLFGD